MITNRTLLGLCNNIEIFSIEPLQSFGRKIKYRYKGATIGLEYQLDLSFEQFIFLGMKNTRTLRNQNTITYMIGNHILDNLRKAGRISYFIDEIEVLGDSAMYHLSDFYNLEDKIIEGLVPNIWENSSFVDPRLEHLISKFKKYYSFEEWLEILNYGNRPKV